MRKQIIVMGAGVGGLAAAIYSRLRGNDVVLLEAHEKVGGKAASIETGGYRFDPGPSIIILTRIYEQLFTDAGRSMGDYLKFRRLEPLSRVYLAGQEPLDLPSSRDECLRLIRDIAPGDAEQFRKLMDKLDGVAPLIEKTVFRHPYERALQLADPALMRIGMQFDTRKTYKELVDGWFASPLLRAFFYGFPSYGGQTYDSKAPGALLIPYLMIQEGVFYPEGGVGAIPASLERLALELGVETRTGTRVKSIRSSGKRIVGVELEGGEKMEADGYIANVDRLTVRQWLGHPTQARPSFSYFTVQWGLKTRLDGLAHHTLLIPREFERGFEALYRRRRFPEPPIVYLNETAGTDPSCVPPGGSNLFAVVTSPAMERGIDWETEADRCRRIVIDRIRQAGIEWSDEDVEVERAQTPAYFQEAHGNYLGSLYGPDEKERLFGGLFPLRNRDEDYSNLFYSGGSVQPGAGLPMVTLSGKFAAEAAG